MAWYSANYLNRQSITIAGTADGEQTNYQLKLTVYKGNGESSGAVVYLQTHCKDDFSDLRFTKADGETLLDYWVESVVSGTSAVVWIEFDSIPIAVSSTNFYIYYNYASAVTASSGDATFSFFDDFPGDAVDTDKWGVTGTPDVSGGLLHCASTENTQTVAGKRVNLPFAYRARFKYIDDLDVRAMAMSNSPNTGYRIEPKWNDFDFGSNILYTAIRTGTYYYGTEVATSADTWYIVDGAATTGKQDLWVDSVNKNSRTDDWTSPSAFSIYLHAGTNPAEGYWDWAFFRKYTSTEPTWGAWGSEETYSSGGWANIASLNGVAAADIATVTGVAVADIASITGVAV